jgi:hypothetical protein
MKEFQISKFQDLHRIIKEWYISDSVTIYRGVTDVNNHKPTPSVGRDKDGYDPDTEKELLELFKIRALPFLGEYVPEKIGSGWRWDNITDYP